ncbi:MAG: succinate dehydrogenase, hydrophobic membrane anchor protein [Gammaproteobacteria bacterium]|jgi:succinate dehydrogenase / fumarate reductase membrane anchor subunit|nr:succinate dehydrogenase, hydrophobic membrane anchor protein [Gammaproteobacteria bacterium]
MSLESPLNKVLGLGSAKEGTGHWWAQRLTAISLVPLTIWFAIALLGLPHGNYEMIVAWIAQPLNAILIVLLIISLIYHSSLGLQMVIEDYVHGAAKIVVLISVQLAHVVLAVSGIYAVIVVSVGASQ